MNLFQPIFSAPIRDGGDVLAVIFFSTRALSVEWIRFLISFIGPRWNGTKKFHWASCSSKFNPSTIVPTYGAGAVKIFFRLRRRTLRPKAFLFKQSCKSCLIFSFFLLESIPQILPYCIYESMYLVDNASLVLNVSNPKKLHIFFGLPKNIYFLYFLK